MIKRPLILVLVIILCLAIVSGLVVRHILTSPNVAGTFNQPFYIDQEMTTHDILDRLDSLGVWNHERFVRLIADQMSFHQSKAKAGRYVFDHQMTTYAVLNKLRTGDQDPISLIIQGYRRAPEMAGYLGRRLMFDSLYYLQELNLLDTQALCDYIPNTYEFYWTTDAAAFHHKLMQSREHFIEEHPTNLVSQSLTWCEQYILASIVEKESIVEDERARIAGVYLNRLRIGMPLQADPTVVFAVGDFELNRVLNKHLTTESPYNTYLHLGLPPGPICMPSVSALMAVRQAESHDYLYFCAKADNSGRHAFAKTLAQHNRNAKAFRDWLTNRRIFR